VVSCFLHCGLVPSWFPEMVASIWRSSILNQTASFSAAHNPAGYATFDQSPFLEKRQSQTMAVSRFNDLRFWRGRESAPYSYWPGATWLFPVAASNDAVIFWLKLKIFTQ